MSEDMFSTELETGEEVPIKRVGTNYIIGFDHIPMEEFLYYVDALLRDEGILNEYDEQDVTWASGVVVDFGDFDGVCRLKVNDYRDPLAIDATILECW